MSVCLNYATASSGSNDSEVIGMDVAVRNLVRAWFKYGSANTFLCRPADVGSFNGFQTIAKDAGLDPAVKCLGLDPRHPRENLIPVTCMMQGDPNVAELAWVRRQVPGQGFAICGLVHTMSGSRIVRSMQEIMVAPTGPSDALICPSRAVRDAIASLWAIHGDYLKTRFGTSFKCPVQLPVIPLGIETEKFIGLTSEDKRRAQRAALGVDDDELVVLFVGRLSFATKTHPTPMLLAAEEAAKRTKKKIRLVLFGYYKPQTMEAIFQSQVKEFCAHVRCDIIKNNDPRFPDGLWAGADCFLSLIDSIQESFGLTPIEAMASGLPVIASDWDGYRDGVRHGQDGFLIQTYQPPVEHGLALAERYFNHVDGYGEYLCASSQSTAIDVDAAAQAIVDLAENPSLRKNMAENGKRRANDAYDWRHIIRAYENLWSELSAQRRNQKQVMAAPANWNAADMACPNPWAMFESFPTTHLSDTTVLRTHAGRMSLLPQLFKHEVNYFIPALLLTQEGITELARQLRTARTIGELLPGFAENDRPKVWRSLGWLLKFGILERVS